MDSARAGGARLEVKKNELNRAEHGKTSMLGSARSKTIGSFQNQNERQP